MGVLSTATMVSGGLSFECLNLNDDKSTRLYVPFKSGSIIKDRKRRKIHSGVAKNCAHAPFSYCISDHNKGGDSSESPV